MRFLMVSACGEGASILHRIQQEGNDVELFVKDPAYQDAWQGILPKVKRVAPERDTVVIFDFSGMGQLADKLRRAGHFVVGGSEFADALEQDRKFGTDFMKATGVKIPLTVEFDDFSPALVDEFLAKNGGDGKRFVFKPSGKGLSCSLTYCSKDDEDLRQFVAYCDRYFGSSIDSFVIQEFVDGVVLMTECYFDGSDFVWGSLNHTLEVKGVMDGDLGPATGCSGNIVWAQTNPECRVVREGLVRARDLLRSEQYVGPIDLNTVVNEAGVWGLEWTPRFGYDATPTLMVLFEQEVGQFYSDVARGKGSLKLGREIAGGVRMSIPPYPNDNNVMRDVQSIAPNVGLPIRGWEPKDIPWTHWYEVMDEGDDVLRHAHGAGVICCAIGKGSDVKSSLVRPYEMLDRIILPNKQYRLDIAEAMEKQYCKAVEQLTTGNNKVV